jgi:methyl halide transferase
MENNLECCTISCDIPLNDTYWNNQYISQSIGWDLGQVSPPIKQYVDTIKDKNIQILIPGCGNAYEAEYLLEIGFSNITIIDFAPELVHSLQTKFKDTNVKVLLQDFFEHQGSYDLIIEQTFFCALPPFLRQQYVYKMHQLLKPEGKLIGLLFNRIFDKNPPFGGSIEEYNSLFKNSFNFQPLTVCKTSVKPRANSEVFIEFEKNDTVIVAFYKFNGITCNGCKQTVSEKFAKISGVLNVSMSVDFKTVLIVSNEIISEHLLQQQISYDTKYSITQIK